MQDPSQQQTKPRSTAGYQPVVPIEFRSTHAAKGYIAMAAGFGLLFGVGAAMTTAHLKTPPTVSAAMTTDRTILTASGDHSFLRVVEGDRVTAAKPQLLLIADTSTKKSKARKKHRLHKLADWKLHHGAKRKPYVAEKPATEEEENKPTALQLATAAAAQGPFFLAIQGDVTVADFDAATGTIVTYEGEKYVLAKTGTDVSSIQWENFPFNVHYTCNETGSCTLSHAGASAIARLAR
jgi:hypothetical protein